jgi:ADP-heptose:LPS heptosyltransferase
MRILLIRNDKLGDFISSLPACQILKSAHPGFKLTMLVNSYTCDLARACMMIDDVLVDQPAMGWLKDIKQLTKLVQKNIYDAVITLFSTTRVGLAVRRANIPYRLAPATKLAQIFYNHRLTQRRSRSEKPEFEYNLELVRKFLIDQGVRDIPEPQPPFLSFDPDQITKLRQLFCRQHAIDPAHKLLFVHPGHGGSANHLTLQQYKELIENISPAQPFTIILSAGPDELNLINTLSDLIPDIPHVIYHSTNGLVKFAQHIAFADVFIAGSTGPLHIAGALNVPTAGFYTRRRSATALRWQTLNSPERRLAFSPPLCAREEDMTSIDVAAAARDINRHFLQPDVSSSPP